MSAFVDTGFLLVLLTHRSGAEEGWALLKEGQAPASIGSLQLFFVRHGLEKNLIDPDATPEIREISRRAIKLLDWLVAQEIVANASLDYGEAIAVAESWRARLRAPFPSLLLIWAACAVVSGADTFLSFDPRTRAFAKAARLELLPKEL